jgi:uncharacterized protein YcaQ
MKATNPKLTLCEVLRTINDKHQTNSEHDKEIRKLLCTAENMGKRMARKLTEYNKNYDKDWWEANPDYEKSLKQRMDTKYCIG